MRALCVGRHEYLGDHLGRFFGRFGLETTCAVGIEGAVTASAASAARGIRPDVVICDYDLLATMSLDSWEQDELLSRTPVVAVSMTRLPDELHPLDVNGIGGFLYLPQLARSDALVVMRAVTTTAVPRLSASGLADVRTPHATHAAPAPPAVAREWARPADGSVIVRASTAHLPPPPSRDEATAR